MLVFRILGGGTQLQQLKVLHNPGQRVVDLVGHPRCQPANGQHFLALYHHFFHLNLVGNIVNPDHRPTNPVSDQWKDRDIGIT